VHPKPQFITTTTTVGSTPGHVDVSLWYLLRGDRHQSLAFDHAEFTQVRWFHRSDAPIQRCEPELDRFLNKLSVLAL
jgi:hypothetical protein